MRRGRKQPLRGLGMRADWTEQKVRSLGVATGAPGLDWGAVDLRLREYRQGPRETKHGQGTKRQPRLPSQSLSSSSWEHGGKETGLPSQTKENPNMLMP